MSSAFVATLPCEIRLVNLRRTSLVRSMTDNFCCLHCRPYLINSRSWFDDAHIHIYGWPI